MLATIGAKSVVPMVGSGLAGPLGVAHLPRLWMKILLSSHGLLPEGYDECGAGFDAMTLAALGLGRDEVISFIRSEQPKYMAFETWVAHKTRGTLDAGKIEAHNRAIFSYLHDEATARAMREDSGVRDASLRDAVTLNALDDFDQLHAAITSNRA